MRFGGAHVFGALRAGASGFLLEDLEPTDLLHTIRVVAAGDALLAPRVTRRLIEAFVQVPERSTRAPEGLNELTVREREILQLVGLGLFSPEVAAHRRVAPDRQDARLARVHEAGRAQPRPARRR